MMRRAYDLPRCALRCIRYYVTIGAVVFAVLVLTGTLESANAAELRIPEASARYRIAVNRAAGDAFGIDASPARLAAQIHQESGWRPGAQSAYAVGLAQFTPATAKWLPAVCPQLGAFDPWDAGQAVRGAACYDAWLYQQTRALGVGTTISPCARWVFTLRGYNGGLGWINRERRAAATSGDDPNDWADVERHKLRAAWAHRENIDYPRRILMRLEHGYVSAGWAGDPVCEALP